MNKRMKKRLSWLLSFSLLSASLGVWSNGVIQAEADGEELVPVVKVPQNGDVSGLDIVDNATSYIPAQNKVAYLVGADSNGQALVTQGMVPFSVVEKKAAVKWKVVFKTSDSFKVTDWGDTALTVKAGEKLSNAIKVKGFKDSTGNEKTSYDVISAMLVPKNGGDVAAYGSVADIYGSSSEEMEIGIEVPGGVPDGDYMLYLYAERIGSYYATNFESQQVTVGDTVVTPSPATPSPATPSPSVSTLPAESVAPSASPVPTKTPEPTTAPTKSPVPTLAPVPSNTPVATAAATKRPVATLAPVPSNTPVATAAATERPAQTLAPVPSNTPAPVVAPTGQPAQTEVPASSNTPAADVTPAAQPSSTEVPAEQAPGGEQQAPEPGSTVEQENVTYKVTESGGVALDKIEVSQDQKNMEIPDTVMVGGQECKVEAISAGAFEGNKEIEQVTLGKNIKKIEKKAFSGCKNLKQVTLSNKVATVGAESFSGCTSLKKVTLPDSVKTIGAKAFKGCKSLKSITVGKKAKVKGGAVSAVPSLRTTKRGSVVTVEAVQVYSAGSSPALTIGNYAFAACSSMKKVIINSAVRVIGSSAFRGCKKLSDITVNSQILEKVRKLALKGINNCTITVPSNKFKPYRTLFRNKGQGKKVLIAKA